MGKLIGGGSSQSNYSTSRSVSMNKAYQLLHDKLKPSLNSVKNGIGDFQSFLNGNTDKFDEFSSNAGYDFAKDRGQGNIMTMFGASGLRNSGAAMKRLTEFNTDLKQQYIDKYLASLAQQAGLGLSAAQTIGSAGNYSSAYTNSKGKGDSSGGIGQTLGALAQAAAASDERLKENIEYVGTLNSGLDVFTYNYIWDAPSIRRTGVMAQQVKVLQPDALGPEIEGYMTVDYSRIR